MRALRVVSLSNTARRNRIAMPVSATLNEPAASHSVEQERAAITRQIDKGWRIHLGAVLHLAAKAAAFNRRAAELGLPLIVADPSLAVVDAMWRAVLRDVH